MDTASKLTKVFAAFVGERGFEIANEESDGAARDGCRRHDGRARL